MKFNWKMIVAAAFYALGVLGWIYVGGWMILTRPVKGLILAHMAGKLTIMKCFGAVIQGFFLLSLAGGVWCVGYMLSNYFKDKTNK